MSVLHAYVGRLRKPELVPSHKELEGHEPHLRHLLLALATKALYPEDFNFIREDEDEKTFLAFRRELSTLFKGVARVHINLAQVPISAAPRGCQHTCPSRGPWPDCQPADRLNP